MSDRERARAVLRRIHESNVRLSFGPGMHVMTPDKFVFDAVLEALEEVRAQARAEGLRQAAEVAHNLRIRCDWNACSFVNEGERPHECRYPDDFKEYRYEDDIAAALRALEVKP